ncbi:thioredoxin-like 3-3 [Arachis duranensis]|uniref:Thioredoxin-like 3-3 n=1 Tax=Arachis duranensis TaxID=130453 RepID=A0A6P4DY12_ARADU|nr:thioredoxin-like 3-3 [Arachis duranensis]
MEKGLSSISTSSSKEGLPLTPHSNFKTASTDDDLAHILFNIKSSKTSAVINYGASWCRVCSEILPAFHRLSNNFPKLSFVYADIDECPETTQHIRYTPTFQFFRDGEKVDEMYGAGEERLRDRVWLHS